MTNITDKWDKRVSKFLVGKVIKESRYLSEKEMKDVSPDVTKEMITPKKVIEKAWEKRNNDVKELRDRQEKIKTEHETGEMTKEAFKEENKTHQRA